MGFFLISIKNQFIIGNKATYPPPAAGVEWRCMQWWAVGGGRPPRWTGLKAGDS